MNARPVPVDICLRNGLGDAARAVRAMPVLALDTVVLAAAADVLMRLAVPGQGEEGHIPRALAETIVYALILAPLSVGVHRFVLHGQSPGRFSLSPRDGALWRFISASLALSILTLVGFLLALAAAQGLAGAAGTMAFVAVFALVTTVLVRATPLLPALATGAPGAGWGNAFADSAGNGWRIFAVLALVSLPFLFVMLPFAGATAETVLTVSGLIGALLGAALHVAWTAALAAAAANIFRVVAERLARPPEPRR